jgi:hypothetical protein
VDLRTARVTAGLRLYFPRFAIGTDVHVSTPAGIVVAVPPMALDYHLSIISTSGPVTRQAFGPIRGKLAAHVAHAAVGGGQLGLRRRRAVLPGMAG